MRAITVLFVVAAIVAFRSSTANANDQILTEIKKSLEDTPPANFEWKVAVGEQGKTLSTTFGRYAAAAGCTLDIQGQDDGSQRARVSNTSYWFEARRLGIDEEWVLTAYAEGPVPERFAEQWAHLAMQERYVTAAAGGFRIKDLIESKNVKVGQVVSNPARNEANIKLSVSDMSEPIVEGGAPAAFSAADITFSKINNWCVDQVRLTIPGQSDYSLNHSDWLDCGDGNFGPLKSTAVMNGTPVNIYRSNMTFGDLSNKDAFTLEAFGLPVPASVHSSWSFSYIWVFGFGVVLLAIAGWKQFSDSKP